MSKSINITVGCNYEHQSSYTVVADVLVDIVGTYGIVSGDSTCKRRTITVIVPDWVTPSKYHWPLSRPGCISKSGTHDMCFVTCNNRPSVTVEYLGAADQDALIDEAIASGLTLHYPERDGSMATMPVSIVMNTDRDMFVSMIQDWIADHGDEVEDLVVNWDSITCEDGMWSAEAEDDKCAYVLHDDGEGNISLDYIGSK